MRDRGNEVRLCGIKFLVVRYIIQNDDVAHELLRLFTDRCDIKRNILHLEITLLVVRINFDRLASFIGFVFGIQFAYQTAQKVVVQRDFGSVEFRGGLPFQIQNRTGFIVDEQDSLLRVEHDDRVVQ